ncbi:hypothetical protein [Aquifex aeolicus]|uniref:Protein kinase domain-containing protein n=1 Tax=Aquifex aeolicus (strain VF5) TaxID=224324 RepID=O66846_AQUAE|nr:hypothetical protein [Aquifex aeolicus]AAC06806.1 putative protein [Aquifex aeolicus VF5]
MKFSEFIKEVQNLQELAEGWRGKVYTGYWRGKKVAIKVAKAPDKVKAIQKEAEILEKLKGLKGFPQILFKGEDFFVYEFIEGKPFGKLKIGEEEKKRLLKEVLEKAYLLDRMGINRDEFSNIYKNVLVGDKGEVFVIDFDRGTFKKNPSNVRQFLQLLKREGFLSQEEAIELGKRYKENPEEVIKEIRKVLS